MDDLTQAPASIFASLARGPVEQDAILGRAPKVWLAFSAAHVDGAWRSLHRVLAARAAPGPSRTDPCQAPRPDVQRELHHDHDRRLSLSSLATRSAIRELPPTFSTSRSRDRHA